MTIRYKDCWTCHNRGYFYKAVFPDIYDVSQPSLNPLSTFEKKQVSCSCEYGKDYQVWQNRFSHPEYENPLASLSDDEILQSLEEASKDQRAVDSEFDLCRTRNSPS